MTAIPTLDIAWNALSQKERDDIREKLPGPNGPFTFDGEFVENIVGRYEATIKQRDSLCDDLYDGANRARERAREAESELRVANAGRKILMRRLEECESNANRRIAELQACISELLERR